MGSGKRRRRAPCPGCDQDLPEVDAEGLDPACPHCGTPLLPVRVAGFWRRALATGVDLLLLAVSAGSLSYGLYRLAPGPALAPDAHGVDALLTILEHDLTRILAPAAPFAIMAAVYFVLFHAIAGRTPGQRLLSLRVVDRHGDRPGPWRTSLRTLAAGVGLVPGGLGPLWIAFDLEKRAFHDHVAGTYVVRES